MKWIKWSLKSVKYLFFSLLILIALVIILLGLGVFTHQGNALIFHTLQKFEPRLTIDLTEGTIANSPHYEVIRWKDNEMLFEFEQVHYEFDWQCLLHSVCLETLRLESATIVIPESKEPSEPEPENSEPFILTFPLPVVISNLELNNVNVKVAGVEVDVKALQLSADAEQNNISLASSITGLTVILADSEPVQPSKTEAKPFTHLPAILNDASLPEVILPFNLMVEHIQLKGFELRQNAQTIFLFFLAQTTLNYIGSKIHIISFLLNVPEATLSLSGDIDLSQRYPMNIQAQAVIKDVQQLQPSHLLEGQMIDLTSKGDLSDLTSEIVLSQRIDARIENNINLYQDNLPYQLSLQWQQLRWPLDGESVVVLEEGDIASKGDLLNYDLSINTHYHVDQVPKGKLALQGKGDLQSLTLSRVVIDTLQGQLVLNGKLNWIDNIDWAGDLSIKNLQLNELDESYPSNVNGHIAHQVTINNGNASQSAWAFSLSSLTLDANLLEYPLHVEGEIKGDEKNGFNIKNLHLNNDNNKIIVNGQVSEKNDLQVDLDIQDLSKLVADASGEIKGKIALAGRIEETTVDANIIANKLSYLNNDIALATLSGNAKLTELPVIDLQFSANNIIASSQKVERLTVDISPQAINDISKQHQIYLTLKSELVSTQLTAEFIQQAKQWQAGLNKGAIESIQGTWSLEKPFIIKVDKLKDQLNLSEHCWSATDANQGHNGSICFNKFYAGNSGDIDISVHDFMLTSLSPFVPDTLQMEGGVDANLTMLWKNKQKPKVDFALEGKAIALNIKLDETQQQAARYPIEQFKVNLNSSARHTDFAVNIASKGLIDTDIDGTLTPYKQQPSISATVELSVPDFNAYKGLLPQFDKLQGQLQSTIKIQGDIKHPNVVGKLYVVDTAFTKSGVPVRVSDLNTTVDFDQYNAKIDGYFFTNEPQEKEIEDRNRLTDSIKLLKNTAVNTVDIRKHIAKNSLESEQKSTNGRADLSGMFNWENKFRGTINFKADQMLVQDYGKIELYVSPEIDLTFDEILRLEGEINVDKGKITVKELPEGAVSVSKDVIVVDADVKKDSSDLPMTMKIKVNLGDRLRVKAIGLDSYINGELLIRKALQKELTINGELSFDEGSYRAFAQQLVLQDSRIIFRGSPSEPYIYIEAIRDPRTIEDGVTAGVRVTGTPDELTLTIFSDPSMSQQNALSYIMRGHSIEDSSGENNSQIAALLIDMSSSRTSGVMNDIGSKIGIDDLSLASTGQGDEQSVGVKGTIAPGVELSYGVGVFDSFTILAIRYELFKRFYIEASSGLYQAVDAYYEWDWD